MDIDGFYIGELRLDLLLNALYIFVSHFNEYLQRTNISLPYYLMHRAFCHDAVMSVIISPRGCMFCFLG